MKNLNIQTPNKTVSISLANDDLSIIVNPVIHEQSEVIEPGHPLEWSDTLLDGETVTLEDAEKAVAELGTGWRLPTRQELEGILDLSRHEPAIDTDQFPDTQSSAYWTSTPCAWNSAARWVVNFLSGNVYGKHRGSDACVRAVRSGQ